MLVVGAEPVGLALTLDLALDTRSASAGFPDDVPGDTVFCTALDGTFIARLLTPFNSERGSPNAML